ASGYYDWHHSKTSLRRLEDEQLKEKIQRIHRDSRQTYGAPRIQMHLRQQGQRHGRNRIARLMRQQGVFGRQNKRYRLRTTDSHHEEPIAPNRMEMVQASTRPNQISEADIIYVDTAQVWVYVTDCLVL